MRQFLIDLLKALEAAVPPPALCHHAITYAQYGSDETGWEDRLAIQVNRGGKFQCLFLDDGDFRIPAAFVVAEIVKVLSVPGGQPGVAFGQHVDAERLRAANPLPHNDSRDWPEGGAPLRVAEPVDRSARVLTNGKSEAEMPDYRESDATGQQKSYVVLTAEERAKGFVRPVRRTYTHVGVNPKMRGIVLFQPGKGGCGTNTTMGQATAETYARDPSFYSGTFCCNCQEHRPLNEFVWTGTTELVGS